MKKLPKELLDYWEARLKGVEKRRSYREIPFDPHVLSKFIDSRFTNSKSSDGAILQALFSVFHQLPKRQREALTLYFGLDRRDPMTVQQIGKELGMTHQNVSILIKRGKAQLKKRIGEFLKSQSIK
jgi:RNA polymerase sigma factor (sigma-70 family)